MYVKNSIRHFCVGVVSHFAQYILSFFSVLLCWGGGGGGGVFCIAIQNFATYSLLGWGFFSFYLSRKAESKINSYIL